MSAGCATPGSGSKSCGSVAVHERDVPVPEVAQVVLDGAAGGPAVPAQRTVERAAAPATEDPGTVAVLSAEVAVLHARLDEALSRLDALAAKLEER